jgi:cytochrome c-type biogenesis protein CcmE
MKTSPNTVRIGIAVAVIVGTIAWLAWSGIKANESYLVHISELGAMGDKAYHSQLRVDGFVVPGSIEQNGTHVTFVMNEFESHSAKAATGRKLTVVYHATVLQAKCASKYAPAQPGSKPGTMLPQPTAAPNASSRAANAAPANPATAAPTAAN